MGTHYAPRKLAPSCGIDTEALYAVNPGGGALVFVHGFNGLATSTWRHFPGMLPGRPTCAGADAFFFGYDSLRTPATVSAALLREFLNHLWQDPAAIANAVLDPAVRRPSEFRYQKLTLVAHSLGSIVARQAMVNGMWQPPADAWTGSARLVLFAPAHKGAKVQALAMECLSGLGWLGSLFTGLLKQRYQTLNDLEPGSLTLQELEQRVQSIDARGDLHIRASSVIWGQLDTVVQQVDFGNDPPPQVIVGKGHVDVCKPTVGYDRPLEILEAAL